MKISEIISADIRKYVPHQDWNGLHQEGFRSLWTLTFCDYFEFLHPLVLCCCQTYVLPLISQKTSLSRKWKKVMVSLFAHPRIVETGNPKN